MATIRNNAINSPALGGYTAGGTNRVLLTNANTSSNVISDLALTAGTLVMGTATTPVAGTLTAGAGISIDTGTPGTIAISSTGADVYTVVAGTSQTIAAGGRYIANNAGATTFTLPSTMVAGSSFSIVGSKVNTGGWNITVGTGNAGQQVQVGDQISLNTLDDAIALSSTAAAGGDAVTFVCTAADSQWVAVSTQGVLSVVNA